MKKTRDQIKVLIAAERVLRNRNEILPYLAAIIMAEVSITIADIKETEVDDFIGKYPELTRPD